MANKGHTLLTANRIALPSPPTLSMLLYSCCQIWKGRLGRLMSSSLLFLEDSHLTVVHLRKLDPPCCSSLHPLELGLWLGVPKLICKNLLKNLLKITIPGPHRWPEQSQRWNVESHVLNVGSYVPTSWGPCRKWSPDLKVKNSTDSRLRVKDHFWFKAQDM